MVPCELDIKSTPFSDATIITYKIELPPARNKIVFDLLDEKYFTIPYIIDMIPNSPFVHQLPTKI